MNRYAVAGDVQNQSIDMWVGMILLRSDTTAIGGHGVGKLRGQKIILRGLCDQCVARSQYEFCGCWTNVRPWPNRDFVVEKPIVRLGANEFFVILSFEVNMWPLWFQTRKSVVLLVTNYMYLSFQTRKSVVLLVMNYMYLLFQTRKSVVLLVTNYMYLSFQTRKSVVLLVMNCMYLSFQTKMSVVLLEMYMYLRIQTRMSVVLYWYFVENCRSALHAMWHVICDGKAGLSLLLLFVWLLRLNCDICIVMYVIYWILVFRGGKWCVNMVMCCVIVTQLDSWWVCCKRQSTTNMESTGCTVKCDP